MLNCVTVIAIVSLLCMTSTTNSASGCLILKCNVTNTEEGLCCFDFRTGPSEQICEFKQMGNKQTDPDNENVESFSVKPVNSPRPQENATCFESLYENITLHQAFKVEMQENSELEPELTLHISRTCCPSSFDERELSRNTKSCLEYTTTSTTTQEPSTVPTFSTTLQLSTSFETTTLSNSPESLFTLAPNVDSDNTTIPPSVEALIKKLSNAEINETQISSDGSLTPSEAEFLDDADASLDKIAESITEDVDINVGSFEVVTFHRELSIRTLTDIKNKRLSKSRLNMLKVEETSSKMTVAIAQFPPPKVPKISAVCKVKEKNSQLTLSKYQPTNGHFLGITVYNHDRNTHLQASLSFTQSIKNDTAPTDIIASLKEANNPYKTVFIKANYVCQYYDVKRKTYSDYGCQAHVSKEEEITCYCNHTTIFAVLLAVETYEIPETVVILSYIFESISVSSLIFTLLVLTKVKKLLRNDRTIVQINLTVALMLFHIVNLFYDLTLRNNKACEVIAVLIQYFLLATGFWMFVEGFNLFIKTTDKSLTFSSANPKKVLKVKLFVGWGLPAFIVCLSSAIGFTTNTYMEPKVLNQYRKCWLSSKSGMLIGAVIVPLSIVYILNFLIAVKVLIFVFNMSRNTDQFKPTYQQQKNDKKIVNKTHINAALKGFILLFPVLGISWICSFLSGVRSYEASLVFMYLNVIFNGLQGLFLMLVYCVFGSEVRKVWVRKVNQKISSMELWESKSSTGTSPMGTMTSSQTNTRSITVLK